MNTVLAHVLRQRFGQYGVLAQVLGLIRLRIAAPGGLQLGTTLLVTLGLLPSDLLRAVRFVEPLHPGVFVHQAGPVPVHGEP